MVTKLNRRQLLLGTCALSLVAGVGSNELSARSGPVFLTAADASDGRHCLLGLRPDGTLRFCLSVPYRAHDSIQAGPDMAIYFARRPGRECYVVDIAHGELLTTITAAAGVHFCGHGTLSGDRQYLFMTEYAFDRRKGVIGVYEARPPFQRVAEFATGGLDPHQLAFLPDQRTLVVANGGILTHPDSEREMLNLDTMAPSLVYLDSRSGKMLEQRMPPHHQISLRHLAVSRDGVVVIGAQDHTPGIEDRPHALVFQHRLGEDLQPFDAGNGGWNGMRQYIASIAMTADGRLALSTTPRGGLVSLWQLADAHCLGHFPVRDVAGAVWSPEDQSFLLSNGQGQLVYLRLNPTPHLELAEHMPGLHWDNHLSLSSAYLNPGNAYLGPSSVQLSLNSIATHTT